MSKLARINTEFRPFELMQKLEEAFSTNRNTFYRGSFSPPCDITEEEDASTIYLDIPGMSIEKVEISTSDRTLIVKGERVSETSGGFTRSERIFGNFVRTWTVPSNLDLDAVEASYAEGVLKIRVPKKPEATPKTIQINVLKS